MCFKTECVLTECVLKLNVFLAVSGDAGSRLMASHQVSSSEIYSFTLLKGNSDQNFSKTLGAVSVSTVDTPTG